MRIDEFSSDEVRLRRMAEERLDKLTGTPPTPEDAAALLHELRVHQIELEMQNDELRRAQLALQTAYEKYFELFDQAPLGYMTLSQDGVVDDTNLTAMRMLGLERPLLVGRPFGVLVYAPDSDRFYLHQLKLARTGEPQVSELRLRFRGGESAHFWVRFESRLQKSADGEPPLYSVTFSDITEHKHVIELLARSLSTSLEVVSGLVETRSPHTPDHQRRVSALATRISEEMGMTARETEQIRIAALIHDVDKLTVPAEILDKPAQLTEAELKLVKNRARTGRRILESASVDCSITDIVEQYHERCDGSGYPRGLTGENILTSSKVLMVADVVEAMVSDRPHRPALGIDAALDEITVGAGNAYDADVCSACTRLFREGRFEFPSASCS